MRARIILGAEAAYAAISSGGVQLDVRLAPGRAAAHSLRQTADEWRAQAARLVRNAQLAEDAADQLAEDDARGRR